MTDQHCVIIGASHAAASMAATLRQEGWEGTITIVGEEQHLPYHRPPLSKAALIGDKDAASLAIRPADFYDTQGIALRLGVRAERIDRQAQRVVLSDGTSLAYTRLALMTGALPRRISLPGSDLNGVHYLRDMRDVDAIRSRLKPGKSVVIVGGGYIGLETAASLRSAGLQVTVLEAMSRVLQRWPRICGRSGSRRCWSGPRYVVGGSRRPGGQRRHCCRRICAHLGSPHPGSRGLHPSLQPGVRSLAAS